ncbi:8-amino-7-oxononanoate synthase [Nocardioides speluncae]|uniref:8-amino-7-oxononanoate synthase n=1 Tax=Nocardioides speluncae TaxID=2670337 RepID=UPI000D69A576|nr:8-amino-7-oxononanoate synthase [Nocardioides speluncae]
MKPPKRAWEQWLAAKAEAREQQGLTRRLTSRGPSDPVVDLAGNDYLGLSRSPAVAAAAAEAAREWGAGSGASRLVTGTTTLHTELEQELADFLGQPAALVFSTGYQANLAIVSALADRETLIVSDAHIHASLIDATRLSRATVAVAPHNDVEEVRRELAAADGRRTLVLVESIFSVLGDAAPLADLAAACEEYDALLVVDEAHGLGVAGAGGHGLVRELGLAGHPHVVVTATLSKSLGAQGGAVLGSPQLVEHLVNQARPFIFDTALAPASAAGALASLRMLRDDPALPALVTARTSELAARLGVGVPAGAVLSVPMPTPHAAVAARAACLTDGVRVGCFRPPSVPDGISRLRITASAGVSADDWRHACGVLERVVKELA